MDYYNIVSSLNELLGEEGLLRLPAHLPKTFVLDEIRRKAIETAVNLLKQGKNVLIEGSPGTGKTALMFMVLKEIAKTNPIGFIKDGVSSIGNDHISEGIILFYDDLPRMRGEAIQSIIKNKVKGIIATARSEEIAQVKRLYGINLYENFEPINLPPLSDKKIKELLLKYLEEESIKIRDKEAIEEVTKKAQGLPVYIWQIVRELKIKGEPLTTEYSKTIPRGMLDYIDTILWRTLGGKEERHEALLTLLTMTDFTKYRVHQDLYNYIYMVAKEKRLKVPISKEDIILDTALEDITRYLAREGATYSFRLPHDSWADVLKGKSNGPMSPEISKINTLYDKETRREIVIEAARRTWHETLNKTDDPLRIEHFKHFIIINLGEDALNDIITIPPSQPKIAPKNETREEVVAPTIEDPLELLKIYLSKVKVSHIAPMARYLGTTEKEIKDLLEISDFHKPSLRKKYIYYRDHYISQLKRIDDLIKKSGKISIRAISEKVKMFQEDVEEYVKRKYILVNNTVITPEYIKAKINQDLKNKGIANIEEIAKKENIPIETAKKIAEKMANEAKQEIKISKNKTKIYTKKKIEEAIREALKGEKPLREIAKQTGINLEDLQEELEKNNLTKQYTHNRLKKLAEKPLENPNQIMEIEQLANQLLNQQPTPQELNTIGVAYIRIWETTKQKTALKKAIKTLQQSNTPKAIKNLAILYAKTKNYKKAKQYKQKIEPTR